MLIAIWCSPRFYTNPIVDKWNSLLPIEISNEIGIDSTQQQLTGAQEKNIISSRHRSGNVLRVAMIWCDSMKHVWIRIWYLLDFSIWISSFGNIRNINFLYFHQPAVVCSLMLYITNWAEFCSELKRIYLCIEQRLTKLQLNLITRFPSAPYGLDFFIHEPNSPVDSNFCSRFFF